MLNLKEFTLLFIFLFFITPLFAAPIINNSLKLFVEPDAANTPIITQINDAKKSIKITMYQFTFAERKIINALIKKAHENIKIKIILQKTVWPEHCNLILNKFYSCKSNIYARRLKNLFEKNNIQVHWGSNKFPYTHQKSIIIDNNKAIIMTMNLSGKAFTTNREYAIIDYNKRDIADIKKLFNADWRNKNIKIENQNLIISPINARRKINNFFALTKTDLLIQTEILGDTKIINKLIAIKNNGANIKIIVAPPQNYHDKNILKHLTHQGIEIKINPSLYMHAKMFVINGALINTPLPQTYVYIGSINLINDSIDKNRELGIIFKNSDKNKNKIIKKLITIFNNDWNKANFL